MSSHPDLWVIAGPNGAGKSTLVQRCKLFRAFAIVNPDEIAAKLASQTGDFQPATQIHAGRLATEERLQLLKTGKTFGIETTLSGHAELKLMEQAKRHGYKTNLIFVSISSPAQSNARVGERTKRGGHNIPENDIYRRFDRIAKNLTRAILLADNVHVYDNSYDRYKLVFKMNNKKYQHFEKAHGWVEISIQNALSQI